MGNASPHSRRGPSLPGMEPYNVCFIYSPLSDRVERYLLHSAARLHTHTFCARTYPCVPQGVLTPRVYSPCHFGLSNMNEMTSQEEGPMAADVSALIATLVQLSELDAVWSSDEVAMQHAIYAQGSAARTLMVCFFMCTMLIYISKGLRRSFCDSFAPFSHAAAFSTNIEDIWRT